jgi:competence protein ComEC
VREAYTAAGAMHVLAVSGLHVGMIYGIILFLFGKIKLLKGGRFYFAALTLVLLWIYAGITGLPASVLRAVTMLSVIVIAQALNRQTNIYNSLAIAATVLLIYNPSFIMSVGFQLSFLAVVGIVYFFPKIYNLLHPENWLMDKIWILTSIAIAAQLATFPISIYYFHQFPVYFFLSNLIVIPAAFVILGNGLAVLIMSFSETITNILAFVLENLIYLVNQSIFALDYIPYHIIKDLYISPLQTVLVYLFIVFIAAFFHFKDLKQLWLAGFSLVIFTGVWLFSFLNQLNQHKIIFYSITNLTAIDFIEGHTASLWLGEDAGKYLSKLQFHISPGRISSGLSTEFGFNGNSAGFINDSKVPSTKVAGNQLLVWNQNKILLVDHSLNNINYNSPKLAFEYLVVRNNYKQGLRNLVQKINFKKLIIDGSNNFYNAATLEKEAIELGIDFHSTRTMGAFVVDLNK